MANVARLLSIVENDGSARFLSIVENKKSPKVPYKPILSVRGFKNGLEDSSSNIHVSTNMSPLELILSVLES